MVRFDYNGTGDSAGGSSDARLAAWMATARAALALLRRHGLADVCLVGMRFGAMLAAAVAERDRGVDQLVLWDPCADRSVLELLAEQRFIARLMGEGRAAVLDDGALEAPGVVYDAATVADIHGMSIARCARVP